MDSERQIIQRISKNKLRESETLLALSVNTPLVKGESIVGITDVYQVMLQHDYDKFPEDTHQKKSFREIEDYLIELGADISKADKIDAVEIPGEFFEGDVNPGKSYIDDKKNIVEDI